MGISQDKFELYLQFCCISNVDYSGPSHNSIIQTSETTEEQGSALQYVRKYKPRGHI